MTRRYRTEPLLCVGLMSKRTALRLGTIEEVFGDVVGFVVETAQFFGAPLLGRTFDPLDYVMYAAGVLLAAFLDVILFPRLFPFWEPEGQGAAQGG